MCFDNDYDVSGISNIIGLESSEYKNRSDTTINPITKEHNCAYWVVETETIETYDSEVLQMLIQKKTYNKINEIKSIADKNNGEIIYRLIVNVVNNETPTIMFERDFLNDVNYLNSKIDILMLIDE
jgi:glutamate-1-semialdehyde aminotransferase